MADFDIDSLEQRNADLVTRFCKAWETKNIEQLLGFLHESVYYQMWDADDAIKVNGTEAFQQVVGGFLSAQDTVEFEIRRTQCLGKIVINERTDRFISESGEMVFTVTGVFVVEDDRIVWWKDYLFPGSLDAEDDE